MSDPVADGERFLYDRLSASAELAEPDSVGDRMFPDPAPPGTDFPYLVWIFRGAPQGTVTSDIEPVAQRLSFLVLGVHETGTFGGTLEEIAGAVYRALHKQQGALPNGGYVHSCSRFGLPFRDTQVVGGRTVKRLGHEYRMVLKDNV